MFPPEPNGLDAGRHGFQTTVSYPLDYAIGGIFFIM
jgi:hypothetical protein